LNGLFLLTPNNETEAEILTSLKYQLRTAKLAAEELLKKGANVIITMGLGQGGEWNRNILMEAERVKAVFYRRRRRFQRRQRRNC
jgi:pyridoxal/pyridoxine/pyridoxamine kinase